MWDNRSTRRKYLKIAGGAISMSLAGCASGGGGEQNNTETEETTTLPPQDELTQAFKFDARNTFEAAPAVNDTTVFAPNADRKIYAVDVESGESIWSYEFNEAVTATPAVGQNAVITNREADNEMYSFNPDSGDINWSSNPNNLHPTSPAYNGELVFFRGNGVKAYNGDTGELEWDYQFDGTLYISSTVQLTSENVVNISEYGVFAVSQDDGSEQWTFEGSGEARTNSLATSSDRIIYADDSNSIYIIDSQSGNTVHQISTQDTVSNTSLIDGILYYVDDSLRAFDINSMSEVWSADFYIDEFSDETLGGYLFGIDFKELVGVDISNGEVVLTQSRDEAYQTTPVIAGDYVVVSVDSNSLLGYQIVSN